MQILINHEKHLSSSTLMNSIGKHTSVSFICFLIEYSLKHSSIFAIKTFVESFEIERSMHMIDQ